MVQRIAECKLITLTARTYYISDGNDWGYFTLDPALGLLQTYTSFGTHSYCWPNEKGDGFKLWIAEDYNHASYLAEKLTRSHRPDAGYVRLLQTFLTTLAVEMELIPPPPPPKVREAEQQT